MSVITVALNAERTVARTIESVLCQSYSKLEYILVDGGSTDGTVAIAKEYESKFRGRMRLVSEKDKGIYDAMNKGIGMARGTIVGLINSDDWYEPDAIETIATAYQGHGDAVYYGILRVVENGKEVMLKLNNYQFLHREVVGHPAYFLAKTIYQEHGLYSLDYEIAADFELMMRLIRRKVPFIQIDKVLANFSQGGQSTSRLSKSIEEYLRIRCRYGYITQSELRIRLIRLKISRLLDISFKV